MWKTILPDQHLSDQTRRAVPEPSPLKAREGEWHPLDSSARLAPYIVPEQNHLSFVKKRITALVDKLQDGLWSLRENPALLC